MEYIPTRWALVVELNWLREQRAKVSKNSETGRAIDYSLKRWTGSRDGTGPEIDHSRSQASPANRLTGGICTAVSAVAARQADSDRKADV